MKLQDLFSEVQYNECLDKIKQREFFDINIVKNPYKFRFDFRACDNGMWKDNLMVSYGASFKDGGFGFPEQYDEMPSYEKMCDTVNSFWERSEKRDKKESLTRAGIFEDAEDV